MFVIDPTIQHQVSKNIDPEHVIRGLWNFFKENKMTYSQESCRVELQRRVYALQFRVRRFLYLCADYVK